MKMNLKPETTLQLIKLFKLYRLSIISSFEFLEIINKFLKEMSPELVNNFKDLILTREKSRREESTLFKPL